LYNVQVNNEWCEPNLTTVEDSASSDAVLVHRPAVLCRQPSHCSDSLLEQRAGGSRHDSATAVLESASLSSYNAVTPQLSRASVSHTSIVHSWQQLPTSSHTDVRQLASSSDCVNVTISLSLMQCLI